jgi:dTDP-4-amino-4,6-dideoxygalactose transaminase
MRRRNALSYRELLDKSKIFIPDDHPDEFNTYHTFVIQVSDRDRVKMDLLKCGIETSVHYPIPIHLQPASRRFGYQLGSFPVAEKQAERILTLPVHQYLNANDIAEISKQVNRLT